MQTCVTELRRELKKNPVVRMQHEYAECGIRPSRDVGNEQVCDA